MPEEGARPVTPEAVLSDSDASGPELSEVDTSVDEEAPQSPVGPVKSGALLLAHERDLAAPAPVSPSVASADDERESVASADDERDLAAPAPVSPSVAQVDDECDLAAPAPDSPSAASVDDELAPTDALLALIEQSKADTEAAQAAISAAESAQAAAKAAAQDPTTKGGCWRDATQDLANERFLELAEASKSEHAKAKASLALLQEKYNEYAADCMAELLWHEEQRDELEATDKIARRLQRGEEKRAKKEEAAKALKRAKRAEKRRATRKGPAEVAPEGVSGVSAEAEVAELTPPVEDAAVRRDVSADESEVLASLGPQVDSLGRQPPETEEEAKATKRAKRAAKRRAARAQVAAESVERAAWDAAADEIECLIAGLGPQIAVVVQPETAEDIKAQIKSIEEQIKSLLV
ncbi:hypothetical protein TeGR_g12129 [Tetraparma gracilis]|uniref:Uncharacterized protein n=1 Tax=Tetraparma gracilis TaxID=2962635 RepID=A0ABQ6M4Q8_9STRA|nr:hypothetical protein TeGR_g12129 [Tetraparma gracilis]